ncbi:MAG: S41 family peptidase [Chloroflexi bacterium]|nr:S41 family peptidase [Chloroflexota bacterium]
MLPNEPEPTESVDAQVTAGPSPDAGTVPAPVQAPAGERRRGWPFAFSMVLVAVLGGGALFMSGYSVGRDQGRAPGSSASESDAWKPFWNVYDAVTTRYPLGPVPRTTLIEGAIRGLMESVGDPYSSYLSPEDYTGTLNDISGTFEGIGAEIGSVDAAGHTSDCAKFGANCQLVVIAPLDGSPAEKAGLQPGDIIMKVDGSTLDGLTPDEARNMVRGKAGTEVVLHIQRFAAPTPVPTGGAPSLLPGATEAPRQLLQEFDVTLVRAKVQRREVTSRVLANGTVGYVSLAGFSSEGAKQLKAAVQAHLDKGIKKIVFDLRGNPGGFLVDSLDIASQFIASGPVYWTEDAKGVQTETDAGSDGIATDPSIQVVVLINRGSASAAEIVAGALQDRGRAKLIGETSFGKGTVQEWIDLGELGGVKLTVNKWLTPNKRWIHKVGLTPDIAVTVPADNPPGADPVLDKALEVLGAAAFGPPSLLMAA